MNETPNHGDAPGPLPVNRRAVQVDAWMCAECQLLYESEEEAQSCYRGDFDGE